MAEEKATLECPYCLSPVGVSDNTVGCESCGTAHHAECWSENGGCCVRDCGQVVRRIELEAEAVGATPDKLVLSREAVESARPHRNLGSANRCIECGADAPEGEIHCRACVVGAVIGSEHGLPPSDPEPREWNVREAWQGLVLVVALGAALAWLIVSGALLPSPEDTEIEPLRMETK